MADAFSLPGPYQQQYNEIARRQKMAEMLQAQAFAPDTAAPSYNGIPVPVSAFSGLSKALAGIGGGYLQNKAIEEQKALGGQYRTETNSLIGQLSGTPAKAGTPEYTYKPEAADIADWEANPANVGKPYPTNDTGMGVQPAIPGTPAVSQTPSQRQQTLMALSNMGGPASALGQSLLSKDIEQDYNARAFEAIFNPPGAPPPSTPPSVLADALEPTGTPPSAPTGAPTATATTPVAPSTAIPTTPAFTVPPIMVNGKVVDQKAVLALMLRGGTLADIGKMLNTNINKAADVAATIRGQNMTAQTAAADLADRARRFKELTADQLAQARKDLAEGIARWGEGYRLIADPDGKIGGIVPSRLPPSESPPSLASETIALELKNKIKIEALAAEIARANAADLKNLSRIPNAETQLKYVSNVINNPVMKTLVGKPLSIVESFVPGTEGYGFRKLVDSIKSGAFLKSYEETLKGGGSITEIEGIKGTQAINRMTIASSVVDFMKAAKDYTDVIERSMGQHKLEAMPREDRNKFIADETKATKDQLAEELKKLRAQPGSNETEENNLRNTIPSTLERPLEGICKMPPPKFGLTSAVLQNGSAIPSSGQGPSVPVYDDNGQDISGSLPPPVQLDLNAPDPRGFLGRARAAFEEGSAGRPGFSSETLEQPGFTGFAARAFQPYVAPVDAALKLATGVGRGVSAGISGLLGGNETEQNQIDRELRNFANLELVRSASPGAYTGGGAMIADALKSVPKIGKTVVNQVGIGTAGAVKKLRENTIEALKTGSQRADDLMAADNLMAIDPAAVARRSANVSEIRGQAEALHRALADTARKERLVIEGNIPGANQELAALQEQRQALVTALENLGTPDRAPFSGTPRGMTEAGGEAQSALVKAQEQIIKSRDATRLKLQTQVDDLVATKENAQASIADLPTAKSMLEEAKSVLNPDVTTANTATSTGVAISKDIRQVNQQIKDALNNRTVSLTANEKKIAEANNLPVKTIPGRPAVLDKEGKIISEAIPETYERTFKSTWEAIDNLRRQFGEAFNGDMRGYPGVSEKLLRDKYDQLKKLQGEFIDIHPEMQKSWADALAAEEKVTSGIGKSLTAIGKDEALTANPTNVVSDIVAQGKTGLIQHLAKGGDAQSTLKLAEDALEQAFYSPTKPLTYEQSAKAVAVNTKLGDMLNALPEVLGTAGKALKSRVDSYLTRLRDAEQSDVNIANIKTNISFTESTLGEAGTRKNQLEKAVGEKQKIEDFNKGLALELATVPTEKALERSRTAYVNAVKNGNISEEQGRYWLDKITKAQKESSASSGKVSPNLGNKIKRFQNELRQEPVETLLAREGNGSIEVKIRYAADKGTITAKEHEVLLKALRKVQALNQNKTRVPATAAAVWNGIKTTARIGLFAAGAGAGGYGLFRLFKD